MRTYLFLFILLFGLFFFFVSGSFRRRYKLTFSLHLDTPAHQTLARHLSFKAKIQLNRVFEIFGYYFVGSAIKA